MRKLLVMFGLPWLLYGGALLVYTLSHDLFLVFMCGMVGGMLYMVLDDTQQDQDQVKGEDTPTPEDAW